MSHDPTSRSHDPTVANDNIYANPDTLEKKEVVTITVVSCAYIDELCLHW